MLPEEDLVAIPDGLDFDIAAGLVITYGTAIHALADRGEGLEGDVVAVLGAAGGAGLAAIEIAKLLGATVIACASSPDKLAICRDRGADWTVDYQTEDLKQRLKDLTEGVGVDIVYDTVGGDYSEAAIRALAWRGRHLVVGFASGTIPKIPLNLLLLKGADIRGVFWSDFLDHEPENAADLFARLIAWAASGQLKPHIHARSGLEAVPQALEDIASRRVIGKIVITP